MQIREIDVHDDRELGEYVDVVAASARHDREHPDLRTVGELAARLRRPDPYSASVLLGLRDANGLVAVAEQWWALQDNTHVADAEIHVRPGHRRQGLGRALHEALDRRRRALGRPVSRLEVYAPLADDATSPGLAFASALGYDDLHVEDHLVLDLSSVVEPGSSLVEPVETPASVVEPGSSVVEPGSSVVEPGSSVVEPVETPALVVEPGSSVVEPVETPGYRLVTWGPLCPPVLLTAFADLRTQMELDVPLGELDYEPVLWDEARVRTDEARTALANHSLVAAVIHDERGHLAGYSQLLLPRDGREAMQEDTLVRPEDRGHGLGAVLKRANLQRLTERHPGVRLVHTWTDPDNLPMHRTNTRLGFRPVERLHEMERHG